MGNDDHCHTLVGKLFYKREDLSDHFGIERAGGLIKKDDLRIHCKRPYYGDTLLLSAREGRRIFVCLILKSYTGKELVRILMLFFFYCAGGFDIAAALSEDPCDGIEKSLLPGGSQPDGKRSHCYILNDRFVVEQIELLEYHSHMAAVLVYVHLHINEVFALKHNGAGGRVLHTVQAAQKCRLSASRGTYDRYFFTFVNGGRYTFQDLVFSEALFQINYVYHLRAASFPSV